MSFVVGHRGGPDKDKLQEIVMYSLVKMVGLQIALRQEAIPFLIAFLIAEFFYKFHSFTLECIGFLVTWYCLSFIQSAILRSRH